MKRHQAILVAVFGAVLLCLAAAAPFISVNLYQGSLALRGASTNLFSSNSVLLNAAVDLTVRTSQLPATLVLSDRPQTFTGTQTLTSLAMGGTTISNHLGGVDGVMEMVGEDMAFCGANTSIALAPKWGFSAIGGGTLALWQPDNNDRYPGAVYIKTVSSATINTGGYIAAWQGAGSGGILVTNYLSWGALFCVYQTNGCNARVGLMNGITASDPTDGIYLSISNNSVYPVLLNNSTKSLGTTTGSGTNSAPYFIPQNAAIGVVAIYSGNGSTVKFRILQNKVTVWEDQMTGCPTNRILFAAMGSVNSLLANANGTAIFQMNRFNWRMTP